MPLPLPPTNIEPIKVSSKSTKIEKEVELITNGIDNSVFISRQDHFRPSLSSTILHCDFETNSNNKNTQNLPTIIETLDSFKTKHQEVQIINNDNIDKNDELVIKVDEEIHSRSIVLNNNDVNMVMEIQTDMAFANHNAENEIKSQQIESEILRNTVDLEKQIPLIVKERYTR